MSTKPTLLTRRDVIRDVRKRFGEQYGYLPRGWGRPAKPECESWTRPIWEALSRLDLETCTEDNVKAAMGGLNWIALVCHACERDVDRLVEVGIDYHEYESCPSRLCADCLRESLRLLEGP